MNVSAISNSSSAAANIAAMQALRADQASSGVNTSKSTNSGRDPAAIKKAASQFEAIILRQLLSPSMESMMSSGLGGSKDSGGGMYGYMLTDTLATSLSQGGGLGLARMLEKQFTSRSAAADIKDNGQTVAQSQLKPLKLP
jgi:peptidoglycan hydrolase FlgJ